MATRAAAAADGQASALGALPADADFDDVLLDAFMTYDLDAAELGAGLDLGGVSGLPRAAAAAPPLRCLDSKHDAARCTEYVAAAARARVRRAVLTLAPPGWRRCAPAPSAAEEEGFVLVSHAKQSGLKALRAALLETREWNSAAARCALADAAVAAGDPHGLVPLLRGKRAAYLGKSHLLLLCRAWGYRSFHWCVRQPPRKLSQRAHVALLTVAAAGARRARRGEVKRKRRSAGGASAALATQAAAQTAVACATLAPAQRPPALGAVDAGSVSALLRERFAPQLAASTAALAGPRALAAARAGGALGFASEHVRAYDLLGASVAALAAEWTRRAASQARWSADAVRCTAAALHLEHGADAAAAPAWRALPYLAAALPCAEEPPVDAMLASLVAHLHAGLAMWQLNVAARLQLLARSGGADGAADARALLPPAVAALHGEFANALHAGLAAASEAAALLAQLRATAPLRDFAAAAEQLAALLARYGADAARALADRAVWARALVAEGVPLQPSLPIRAVPPAWHALAAAAAEGGLSGPDAVQGCAGTADS